MSSINLIRAAWVSGFATLIALPALNTSAVAKAQTSAVAPASAAPAKMTTMQRYAFHDSAAAALRKAGDWARYRGEIVILDSILNGHPNVRVVNARIHAHLGDTATAYASLRNFAAMGLMRPIEADTDLVALRGTPAWTDLVARIKANGNSVGTMRSAFTLPDSEFVAEDIAYDALGQRFFVTSVRRSTIVAVTPDGAISTFARAIAPGWGMLAVVIVADSRSGAVYVIPRGKKLELLIPAGELRSPQGAAVSEGGKYFYLADYARGIARVERSTGRLDWLAHARDIALNGIDGLSMADPGTLIAVQNGTNPNRILKITLDDDGTSVTSAIVVAQNTSSIMEPTHGTFVGSDYYFIANGGYGTFGDDGKIRKGARAFPPVVMRLDKLR